MFCVFASWLNIQRHLHLFFGVVNYLQSPAMEEKHKLSPVSSEHPTCLWFWSSLGIRLFLIQRTSRLKWVSKVLWRTSLVPWLLPSSSLYSLCDQNWWEGAWERGYEKCHFLGPQQKCKGSLYNAYIFMLLMSACLTPWKPWCLEIVHSLNTAIETIVFTSLVPRPHPDFISQPR